MSERTWQGDWVTRIYRRVHKRGFESVTAFAETRSTATLLELAAELGEGVAAIQLEGVLCSEAEKSGTLDRFARGLLVRCIRQSMPTGWNDREEFELQRVGAFARWAGGVRGFLDKRSRDKVWENLRQASIPNGWLPESLHDPILDRVFNNVQFDASAGK